MTTNWILTAILASAIALTSCEKNNGPATCLKGNVITIKCMGTVVQITEGNFDASLVTPQWRDSLRLQAGLPAPEINNVFRLVNPGKHGLKEGEEFYFTINSGETENGTVYCLAHELIPPPRLNGIVICFDTSLK